MDTKNTNLVKLVELQAISSLVPFGDKIPVIYQLLKQSKNGPKDWDFFVTAAGVGTATFVLTYFLHLDRKTVQILTGKINSDVKEWDKQGSAAVSNFINFVSTNIQKNINIQTAVGAWIIWNLKNGEPTNEEIAPAQILGSFLLDSIKPIVDNWITTAK